MTTAAAKVRNMVMEIGACSAVLARITAARCRCNRTHITFWFHEENTFCKQRWTDN